MAGLSPAHERVLVALRQSGVDSGDYLPSEPELALQLGMSRQSVREALVAMQTLGLVDARQGARRRMVGYEATVLGEHLALSIEPSRENLLQTLQVRRVLEHSFLPVAAKSLGRQRLRDLTGLADSMVERAEAGQTFLDLDEQFHSMLYAGLRNRALDGIINGFWLLFRQAPRPLTRSSTLVRTATIHRTIVDALTVGDTELAVHKLDAHFYDVQSRIAAAPTGAAPARQASRDKLRAASK